MGRALITSIFIGIIVSGCDKDMNNVPAPDPKLDSYTQAYQAPDGTFQISSQVRYEYDTEGKVIKSIVSGYNATTFSLEDQQVFNFTYQGKLLQRIEGTLVGGGTPFDTYTYSYGADSRVSVISEDNKNTQLTSTASFIYNTKNDSVRVVYAYSNGQGFEYAYRFNSNIIVDKTTKGSQLCNSGSYTYDQHPNPLSKLGYVDYLLNNVSMNNKLTEEVNYINCSFPVAIPVSYAYTYTMAGLPTVATTSYKGTTQKSQRMFFYK
jgi:hypothetical protein